MEKQVEKQGEKQPEKVWTILELVNWGKQFFEEKSVDSPRLTIELMLAHVLKMPRIQLYTAFDRPLLASELATLRDMVRRRAKREPLQYITGEAHFYNIVLEVNPTVLIPRPETETLVEVVLKHLLQKYSAQGHSSQGASNLRLLDIGTGSGCIALALAKECADKKIEVQIEAWDVSEGALKLAQKNAERLGVTNVRFVECDVLKATPEDTFDVIVSNPPYISTTEMRELEPEVGQFEPHSALTDNADGLTFYKRFAEIFASLLTPEGFFAVEIGFGQASAVAELFQAQGFEITILKDLANIERVCVGTRKVP
jgi:release factor glutamine methyltransferase